MVVLLAFKTGRTRQFTFGQLIISNEPNLKKNLIIERERERERDFCCFHDFQVLAYLYLVKKKKLQQFVIHKMKATLNIQIVHEVQNMA